MRAPSNTIASTPSVTTQPQMGRGRRKVSVRARLNTKPSLRHSPSKRLSHVCHFNKDDKPYVTSPEYKKAKSSTYQPFADDYNLVFVNPAVDPYTQEAPQEPDYEEGRENYVPGGYHPVRLGERYKGGRYTVLSKLGWGNSSTVWLVRDNSSGNQYAMKVQKSDRDYHEAAIDECKVLSELARNDPNDRLHCVRLVDSFETVGPNGVHMCMVLERLGDNLGKLIKRYRDTGVPLNIVRELTRQMLTSFAFFHDRQIIHTDFKPDNCTLDRPLGNRPVEEDQDAYWKCKVVDFGNSCRTYKLYSPLIQTREYRSPEVYMGQRYGTSADMWSLACTVFEMAVGEWMFMPRDGKNFSRDDDHLAQMMELLGPMPERIHKFGMYHREFFDANGELLRIKNNKLKPWPLCQVLQEKYGMDREEAEALTSFLMPMLQYEPEKRATAHQMLQHPWLQGRNLRGGLLPSARDLPAINRAREYLYH